MSCSRCEHMVCYVWECGEREQIHLGVGTSKVVSQMSVHYTFVAVWRVSGFLDGKFLSFLLT